MMYSCNLRSISEAASHNGDVFLLLTVTEADSEPNVYQFYIFLATFDMLQWMQQFRCMNVNYFCNFDFVVAVYIQWGLNICFWKVHIPENFAVIILLLTYFHTEYRFNCKIISFLLKHPRA